MTMPKYARAEHERRFLVRDLPIEWVNADHVLITDLYITATRLRLRTLQPSAGGAATHKLCKKYGGDRLAGEPIVNIYLSGAEHALLAALTGRTISKRRYHRDWNGVRHAIDMFDGALAGMVLSEVEAPDAAALRAISPPPWAAREVSDDPWFRGGHLATVSAEMLQAHMQAIGQS